MSIAASIPTEIGDQPAGGVADSTPDSFWRSLTHLNHFRLFLAAALALVGLAPDLTFPRLDHLDLYFLTCAAYFLTAGLFHRAVLRRAEQF
jgi:hypothetical protein